MLYSFRTGVKSWLAKFLLILLVGAFAAWGVGDAFQRRRFPEVARVGSTSISIEEFRSRFKQMQKSSNLDWNASFKEGFLDSVRVSLAHLVLEDLLSNAAIDEEINSVGLGISQATLDKVIKSSSVFADQDGDFNPSYANRILQQAGWKPSAYVSAIRKESLRRQFVDATSAVGHTPSILEELMFQHRYETRTVSLVSIGPDAVGTVPEPCDAELSKFYSEHENLFRKDEARRIEYILLSPGSYMHRDLEDTEASEKSIDTTVSISQLYDQIEDNRASGFSLREIADVLRLKPPVQHLVTRSNLGIGEDLPESMEEDVIRAVFSAALEDETDPIELSDGVWLFFDLQEMVPSRRLELSEARQEVISAWKKARLNEKLDGLAERIAGMVEEKRDLNSVAISLGFDVKHIDSFKRSQAGRLLPASVSEQAFSVADGGVVVAGDRDTRVVMQITSSVLPRLVHGSSQQEDISDEMRRSMERSLSEQIVTSLKTKHEVRINWDLVKRIIGLTS